MHTAQIVEPFGSDQVGVAHREAVAARPEPVRKPGIGRSLVAARRWLFLPLVLGLLGLVAGLVAGTAARPSAEALLVVQATATDGAGIQLGVKSTAVEINTLALYENAASAAGVEPVDLQLRTQIAALPDSQLVSVTVTAATPAEAVAQANTIVDTAIALNQQRIEAELRQVTGQTRTLIADQRLTDGNAERARVERLGDSLGATQSGLVVGSREITLLQAAQEVRLVPSSPLLGAMGLVAGALLGLAGAIWLATRQGTVRSARTLRELYPSLPIIEPDDLEGVLAADRPQTGSLYVGGPHSRSSSVLDTAEHARQLLEQHGRDVHLSESIPSGTRRQQSVLEIVPIALNHGILRRIAQNDDNVVIVVVEPKKTTLKSLAEIAPSLPVRSYVLVFDVSRAVPAAG